MKTTALWFERILYIFGPTIVAGLLYRFVLRDIVDIKTISADIEANAASAIMGYGFAAVFFLLALPRSGFLRRIDNSGKLLMYSLTIGMASLLATSHLVLSATSKSATSSEAFLISQILFLATILHFIWSLVVLFLLLHQYRLDAGATPARKTIRARKPQAASASGP